MSETTYFVQCGRCNKRKRVRTDVERIERVRKNGEMEGYPKCCINAFIKDLKSGLFPGYERGAFVDGFVPCRRCAKKMIRAVVKK